MRSTRLIRCLKPTDWLGRLYRSGSRSGKQLRDYERYLKRDLTAEDRSDPLWIHRLSLCYAKDGGFELDAKHLAFLAVGESPADYAGSGGFRDQDGLKKYLEAVAGLREQWLLIQQASGLMVDPGEAVFGNFRSQLLGMFARRYALMHSHLLASTSSADKSVRLASCEVLSHSARQCLEIKDYLKQFFDDVSSRAGTVGAGWTFQQRAAFVHSRVEKVFGPAVRVFLETEGAAPRSAVLGFAGAAALGGAPPAPLLGQVASSWPLPASPHLGGPGPAPSWRPPPPYAPPGALPPLAPGYALPAGASGCSPAPTSSTSQDGQPLVAPHPIDGVLGQGAGSAGGQQRVARRTLQDAMDGAGRGGPGGGGAGRSDGQAAGAGPSPSSKVRFDPVVKVEPQRDGGGDGQQKEQGALAQPAHPWLLGKYAPHTGQGALRPECAYAGPSLQRGSWGCLPRGRSSPSCGDAPRGALRRIVGHKPCRA